MGSKSEVFGHRLAEVVGVADLLGLGCLASSCCIEGDRVGGILLSIP